MESIKQQLINRSEHEHQTGATMSSGQKRRTMSLEDSEASGADGPPPQKAKKIDAPSNLSTSSSDEEMRDFVLAVFCKGDNRSSRNDLWKKLPAMWKEDRKVAMEALVSNPGSITVSEDLPECFREDRDFLLEATGRNGKVWEQLSDKFSHNIEFANAIEVFPDSRLVAKVFANFPELKNDRSVWLKISNSISTIVRNRFEPRRDYDVCLSKVYEEHAPPHIRSDADLVLSTYRQATEPWFEEAGCRFLSNGAVDASLFADRTFIKALLEVSPWALCAIPKTLHFQYVDLVVDAFRLFSETLAEFEGDDDPSRITCCLAKLEQFIHSDLWQNRSVVEGWIKMGGPYLPKKFPKEYPDDRELMLLIAGSDNPGRWYRLCDHGYIEEVFCSFKLRSDKKFMLQAVKLEPQLLVVAGRIVLYDFELNLMAAARSCDRDEHPLHHICMERAPFLTTVRHKLHIHGVDVGMLLPGMSRFGNSSSSGLALLDQGSETSLVYKKLIAEFLGVPIGNELRQLRQVDAATA